MLKLWDCKQKCAENEVGIAFPQILNFFFSLSPIFCIQVFAQCNPSLFLAPFFPLEILKLKKGMH